MELFLLSEALTIGQMQGKFQMVVVRYTGHAIQEDAPEEFASYILNFIARNRIGPHGVERPLFNSFKMGLPSSIERALKLSIRALFCSFILMLFLPEEFKGKRTIGRHIIQQIKFLIGTFTVSLCWEISHHLLQVVHTRRCIFAPPQGSAAAETNPSEILLETLEQSSPRSLLQYLAYLDLCMVSESNLEPWRRAAFFEETGVTYRRVVNACLRPLTQFASRLAEGLEGFYVDKADFLSQQLNPPLDIQVQSRLFEAFNDFQYGYFVCGNIYITRGHN